ncbi:hypothetical protein LCGC14_2381010 [marine sediment metagenome]|uniref:Uncharacterized protein n=1 Tax=marine sediment metagenome TaxID=412755 RepID=A0A0F9EVQ8_9ZZZZ
MVTKKIPETEDDIVKEACITFIDETGDCCQSVVAKGLIALMGSYLERSAKPGEKQSLLNKIVKIISAGIEKRDKQEKEGGL